MNSSRFRWSEPFVVFSFLMVLKINLAWFVIFGAANVIPFLVVSIPSVWVLFGLIEWLAVKRKLLFYMLANLITTSIYFAAIMYYKYYGVIVNYKALQQAKQVVQVKASVFDLMHPHYLLIYLDIVILLGVFLWSKKSRTWGKTQSPIARKGIPVILSVSLLTCLMTVWSNRGIANELKQAEQMGILNYQVYTVFANMRKEEPIPVDLDTIRELKNIEWKEDEDRVYWKAAEDKHLIVVQLESFQNFLIGLTVNGQEVTPVLNRLVEQSLYFPKVYQQVGQGNTSDSEYMSNTSFYIPAGGAASEVIGHKEIPSLPKLLKEKGYRSATFHTNSVNFWNRMEMYPALGFDQYYDREFFGDEDPIAFAASDEVLYNKAAAEIADLVREGDRLYAQVISMSNHHPFQLPEDKHRIEIPDKYKETLIGNYLQAASYADYALGLFIDRLEEEAVRSQSVIVMYGDHMGLPIYSLDGPEREYMEELLGKPYEYVDMLNIPLLIYAPEIVEPGVVDHLGGHVDIMPTIANLMGVSLKDHIHFGQDLINYSSNLLPERYYLPSGSYISDDIIFIPGVGVEDGEVYPLAGYEETASVQERDYERALRLLELSDSYLQQLPDRDRGERAD
ncbi:Lipoteichoic acid synthase [Chlamydia abortus]|nr:Lipoteichoic acid synthase [Chlamydia abortus]